LPITKAAPQLRAPEQPQAPGDQVDLSELVDVAHTRELRGAWVASVWNINFPSSPNLPVETQKKELEAMLDRLQQSGFNSIFFHVRPEGDALYKSDLEPFSHYLTGTPGKDPGYDPLEYLVQEAHQRNIEVHAWLNPYRAASSLSTKQVAPHIAVTHPEHVHPYGSVRWMDPGADVVREKLVDVCADLTRRYDLDGIHFDDYFYPYPIEGKDFPDNRTWNAYQAGGGTLNRADWRRENVNRAVRDVNQAVAREKDHVRFGISPFGIPAPDKPEGISGFNQYEGLYADTQKWMDEGWVDYLAPQLYWRTDQPKQAYGTLMNWWADHTSGGRYIFGGNDLTSLGKNSKWNVDEYRKEVALTRAKAEQGAQGNLWWNIGPLMENRQNIADVCGDEFYAKPALTPPLSTAAGKTVSHPQVRVEGGTVQIQHTDAAPLRAWTVYRKEGTGWELDRIVAGTQTEFELPPGQWAVAAASKHGVESQGVVVHVA
jgi:uncharacterized lipoprotein YddW (UPF0748 family)